MKKKTNKHGGPRAGSGAPTKDPGAGSRIMWSGRLHPATLEFLRANANAQRSQAEIVDHAVTILQRWTEILK